MSTLNNLLARVADYIFFLGFLLYKTQSESEVMLESVPREADEQIGHADAVAVLCVSNFSSTSNSNSLLPRSLSLKPRPQHRSCLASLLGYQYHIYIATTSLIEISPTCIYGTHLANQKN